MVTAAILAGGRATRLGGADKSALLVDGMTVLDRQMAALRPLTPRIMLVTDHARRFTGAPVPVVRDLHPGVGPLGGLHTALHAAATTHVLILACDLPFVTHAFLAHLAGLRGDADAIVPRDAVGRHPLCAVYATRLASRVARSLDAGMRRMTDLLDAIDVHEVSPATVATFDPDGRLLTNLNTPDDLARTAAAAALPAPVRA